MDNLQIELVSDNNGKVITDTVRVSVKFRKKHKDVLEAVRKILAAENSATKLMFLESSYCDDRGKDNPMYIMNRDGFMLLAMGFTGAKALEFKLEFIAAFNLMEDQLKKIASAPNFKLPATFAECLRELASTFEAKEIAEHQVQVVEAEKQILLSENNQLQFQTEHQQEILKIVEPKAKVYDEHISSTGKYSTTQVAKDIGMSAIALNQWLVKQGFQFKNRDQWVLKSPYDREGYTAVEYHKLIHTNNTIEEIPHTVWTQKGRLFVKREYQKWIERNSQLSMGIYKAVNAR